jgi:hypothetical protein
MQVQVQLPFHKRVTASAGRVYKREQMLKITRAANGEVVFMVSGRLDAENLAELKTLFSSEAILQNGWLIGYALGV